MIHKVNWNKILIELGDQTILVRQLPLAEREMFGDLLQFISTITDQLPDKSFAYLYDNNQNFRWAVTETFKLFGLDITKFSADQANQMLFAYEGGGGALWQLEFPDFEDDDRPLLKPGVDPYHAAIAAAWSYSPDKTLAEVVESLGNIPWNDAAGIMAERNRQTEQLIEQQPKTPKDAGGLTDKQINEAMEILSKPEDFFKGSPFDTGMFDAELPV